MPTVAVATGLAAAVGLAVAGWAAWTYPRLFRLRALVQESWRQLEVELSCRHDLVPDLLAALRPAGSGSAVAEAVTRVRVALGGTRERGCPRDLRARRESRLTAALDGLFALTADRPATDAGEGFDQLRLELERIEDRIVAGARWYNAAVRDLDTRLAGLACRALARFTGIAAEQAFPVAAAGVTPAPEPVPAPAASAPPAAVGPVPAPALPPDPGPHAGAAGPHAGAAGPHAGPTVTVRSAGSAGTGPTR